METTNPFDLLLDNHPLIAAQHKKLASSKTTRIHSGCNEALLKAPSSLTGRETEENVNLDERIVTPEKQLEHADGKGSNYIKDKKENAANEAEKEPEDNEMTLEEYENKGGEKKGLAIHQA